MGDETGMGSTWVMLDAGKEFVFGEIINSQVFQFLLSLSCIFSAHRTIFRLGAQIPSKGHRFAFGTGLTLKVSGGRLEIP